MPDHARHPWHLALFAALLQLGTVLLAGWTWDLLLWGTGVWLGTSSLVVGVVWGLAHWREWMCKRLLPFFRHFWMRQHCSTMTEERE